MLAARIWLPDDAVENPVPAILEYLPYRKRDGTYERDAQTHPYLAGHGYAGVRVDLRGCGESSGLLFDEYAKQELADGVEVIAWLAAQPWCSGVVGMMASPGAASMDCRLRRAVLRHSRRSSPSVRVMIGMRMMPTTWAARLLRPGLSGRSSFSARCAS